MIHPPAPATSRRHAIGRLLHRWHRRLGVAVCLFVLWLVGSGLALNHGSALGLDHLMVKQLWITRWYGLHATTPGQGYAAGIHWLVGDDALAVLDGQPLAASLPSPLGLIAANDLLFAANASTLAILRPDGQLVDVLRGSDLPIARIQRLGMGNGVVVVADATNRAFASGDGLNWTPYGGKVTWASSVPVPADQQALAATAFRPALPLERVIADAHSGRILGSTGPYLVDAVGVVFACLALSGLWMYLRDRRRNRQRT